MTNSVPVWRYALRSEDAGPFGAVGEAEAMRAAKLRDPARAQDYLHARHLMRALIAEGAEVAVGAVEIAAFDDAPPVAYGIENMGISWSRSGPHALAALVRNGRVGADIEAVREIAIAPMLDMIAVPDERETVLTLGGGEAGLRGFFRLWCAKEAMLKWRGTGLRGGAKTATIPAAIITGQQEEILLEDSGRTLRLTALPLGAACVGFLAVSG